jgi:hypothetical protein
MEWENKKMTISRRNFLRKTTMTSLSAVATLSLANLTLAQSFSSQKNIRPEIFEVPAEAYQAVLERISRQMFVDSINSNFVLYDQKQGKIQVYLKEVEDLRPVAFKNNPKSGHECFNLIFVNQSGTALPQGTYTVEHEKLGTFDLFLVPGVNQRYGHNLGAAVNRLFP